MLEIMARAIWQGYITLGQLGIPVRLYAATQSIRPRFVQLHEKDGSPVERVLRCRDERKEISISETIRAVPVESAKYITLTEREIEQTSSGTMKTINIKQFANKSDVDPIYIEKPFYVSPSRGGERAYALIREVFARSRNIAIAYLTLYNQEHIAALMVEGDLLLLYQLRYAAEIVPRTSIKTPPLPKPVPAEVEALQEVIERYSGPFYIQDFHDTNTERIQELIGRKIRGLPLSRRERTAPHATPETDIQETLMSTLRTPSISSGDKQL